MDTLRLEKGYCLHGNDIDAEHTPVEAGLNWTVGWKTDFRGKAALVDQKEQAQVASWLDWTERGIPRQGYALLSTEGEAIGK